MQENSRECQKIHKSKGKPGIYFLINFKHVKISQNSQEYIKKHIGIFLGIFTRKIKRTGVQIARTEVCIAKNSRKKSKGTKGPRLRSPNPRSLWIQIFRMPQRRWIDPDSPRPRSNGQGRRELDRV